MKLTTILTFLLSASPALTCLQISGLVNSNQILATITDGVGQDYVCNGGGNPGTYRKDQDGHWSLSCWPGYVFAITTDGSTAWYRNPVQAWTLHPTVQPAGVGITHFYGHWFCG